MPLPNALAVAVMNDALLAAVHPQLSAAVTVMFVVPPPLLIFTFVLESVTVQPVGAESVAALCVKFTTVPLIVMLADRAAPVFAAML